MTAGARMPSSAALPASSSEAHSTLLLRRRQRNPAPVLTAVTSSRTFPVLGFLPSMFHSLMPDSRFLALLPKLNYLHSSPYINKTDFWKDFFACCRSLLWDRKLHKGRVCLLITAVCQCPAWCLILLVLSKCSLASLIPCEERREDILRHVF